MCPDLHKLPKSIRCITIGLFYVFHFILSSRKKYDGGHHSPGIG